jgi:hypothetical protein
MPSPEDPLLRFVGPRQWTNFHGTVRTQIAGQWLVENNNANSTMAGMRDTAARLQRLIRYAAERGIRLRPMGSRWSFSEVAVAPGGWSLQTDRLNFDFTIGPRSVDPAFSGEREGLRLVQTGASLAEINRKIEAGPTPRSLRTSGASNGQTIGGALGTGTHGSAIDRAALEGEVLGLQLLTAESNLWMEHPNAPVLNANFAKLLGADLVRDAALFSAALVSLGALGLVHAVLLRTAPRYMLRSFRRKMPVDRVIEGMKRLDFNGVELPFPNERPYFFQMVLDPAQPDTEYVTMRYREPCPDDYVTDPALRSGYEAGNDLPGVFATLLDVAPPLRQAVVSLLLQNQLAPFENKLHTPAETYSYTSSRPGTAGGSIAVPAGRLDEALELARQAFLAHPDAPAAYACRFAQASPACMGFTRFDPTCIIDIDGLASTAIVELMEGIRTRFDAARMPYAQHWGKLHRLTAERVAASHGDRLADWHAARGRLLPTAAERHVFSTDLLHDIGLA